MSAKNISFRAMPPFQLNRFYFFCLFVESSSKELYTVLTAQLGGESIPLPFADPDACDKGVTCPVEPGKIQMYKDSIYIESDYPLVSEPT